MRRMDKHFPYLRKYRHWQHGHSTIAFSRCHVKSCSCGESLDHDFGNNLVQAQSACLGQRMQLLDQVAIEFDGKWHKAERLVALALLALIDDRAIDVPETGSARRNHLAHEFFRVALCHSCFF